MKGEDAFRAWIETWPIWPLIRAFGFSAYVWLFLTVAAGMLASLPFVPGKLRGILNIVHRQGARWGLGFLLLHMLLLSIDPTMPFPWTAIVFPSFADARSAVYGLGIFAFYGLIIVMVTSGAVKVIGQAMWRKFHLLSYPTFLLAFFHGVFAGTDSQALWAVVFYEATVGMIALLDLLQFVFSTKPKAREKPPQTPPARRR
ncbi:MAG: hypothetical protein IMX05_09840 [Hydrogenibacillus schlegelii]|nr:hypothetical protein [Hydrogenibacillus schlegelii]